MGARSLLLIPAGVLMASLGGLGVLHTLLLFNGLTTSQYVRRWRARGMRSVRDLVWLHGEPETDKWGLLWGETGDRAARGGSEGDEQGCHSSGRGTGRSTEQRRPTICRRLRVLTLPSLPAAHVGWSPGVAHGTSWVAAAVVLTIVLLLLLPLAAFAMEALVRAM